MKRPALTALTAIALCGINAYSPSLWAQPPIEAGVVRGIIEYYRPLENEALVKLRGQDDLYFIRHLTALPEDRLHLLLERLQSKEPLQLIFDEHNYIIDIRP